MTETVDFVEISPLYESIRHLHGCTARTAAAVVLAAATIYRPAFPPTVDMLRVLIIVRSNKYCKTGQTLNTFVIKAPLFDPALRLLCIDTNVIVLVF